MLWLDQLLILLPGLALVIWAQVRVYRATAEASQVATDHSGAEAAELVLRAGGVEDIAIEPASGELSDYYDPRGRVLRISRRFHDDHSLAAVGVAVHEAGHAIQEAARSPWRFVRNALAPIAGIGAKVVAMLIVAGVVIDMFRLVALGIDLFLALVVIQLLNVPAERDAGRRGREAVLAAGLVSDEDRPTLDRLLDASAWKYVAQTLTGALPRPVRWRPDVLRHPH